MGRLDDPIESVRLGLYVRTRPQRLVEAYRLAIDIANRPKIRSLCSGSPPTEPQHDELETFLRAEAVPHAVGTCAMGLRPEDGAVVDPCGHVHGTERLTVIDASIMPDVPSGFTHVPTIMIAERLSEQLASSL